MDKFESGNAVLQTIHASEGGRALKLLKQRQKRHEALEKSKEQIENEGKKKIFHKIDEKYQGSTTEALEEQFRQQTVGLVTADEFREARKKLEELKQQQKNAEELEQAAALAAPRVKKRQKTNQKSKLSFQLEGEEEDEESSEAKVEADAEKDVKIEAAAASDDASESKPEVDESPTPSLGHACASLGQKKKNYFGKDPTVNTSFLADAERSEKIRQEQERLIKEYYEQLEREKSDVLEVTYSYWDGSGHRRTARVKKGSTIGHFINECRNTLEKDFRELKSVSNENLLFVKEDLILPHHVTFHDLIRTKARGKSGPLFNYDVHDDVRLQTDTRIEKDESHAGKIVDRKWYEKNKHIFPVSRWEMYDPNKTFEKYTIKGD